MAKKVVEQEEKNDLVTNEYLPNKRIVLKPTPRQGQIVDDPEHKMYFMMEDAINEWKLPLNAKTGQLRDPFKSVEEREFFEKEMDTDLNIFNKERNFWWDFKVQVSKTPTLLEKGIVFDLSNPIQNLQVKILKMQEDIAPTWTLRKKKPGYKWVLVDETQAFVDKSTEADQMAEAYAHYATIKDSESKMYDFLRIYGATNNMRKSISRDTKKDFLKSEVFKIIESNLKGYLAVINSGDYETKIMLERAVEVGAIENDYNKYKLPGGDLINPIDSSYAGTVHQLKEWSNPQHEDYDKFLTIKARINNAK